MAAIQVLLLAAFVLVCSLLLTIFACTLIDDHNAYPLIPLIFYIFVPVPYLLCVRKKDSIYADRRASTLENLGTFLVGLFSASGPCMSLVLYHTGKVTLTAMFMSLGSAVLLVGAAVLLGKSMKKEEDQFAY